MRQQVLRKSSLFVPAGELLGTSHLDIRREETSSSPKSLAERIERFERFEIQNVLAEVGGHVAKAAEILEINRATLYRRMQALGLKRGEPK